MIFQDSWWSCYPQITSNSSWHKRYFKFDISSSNMNKWKLKCMFQKVISSKKLVISSEKSYQFKEIGGQFREKLSVQRNCGSSFISAWWDSMIQYRIKIVRHMHSYINWYRISVIIFLNLIFVSFIKIVFGSEIFP